MSCILPGGCVEETQLNTDNWLSLNYWITSETGLIHVIAAIICIALGPVIFGRKKGTRQHVWLGRFFVIILIFVNISALMTYELGGRPNLFHGFAILNLAMIISGWLFIFAYQRSKNPKHLENHRECMAWAYFGLAAAGIWQIVISLARIGAFPLSYGVLYNGLGGFTVLASISMFLWLKRKRKSSM